jgi:hypothetical protein
MGAWQVAVAKFPLRTPGSVRVPYRARLAWWTAQILNLVLWLYWGLFAVLWYSLAYTGVGVWLICLYTWRGVCWLARFAITFYADRRHEPGERSERVA